MFGSIEHRFGNSQDNFKKLVYRAKQQKYRIALENQDEQQYIQRPVEEVHKEIWELYDFDNDNKFDKHNPNKLCNTEYNIDQINTDKEMKKMKATINFLDITKKAVKNKYEKKF